MLKESGLKKDCVGKEYMVGKKNQSLISYADRAAKNAMKRVLLHLIYTEWMLYKGLECRIPYPIEYLGHKHLITVDEIMNYDIAQKAALKAGKE